MQSCKQLSIIIMHDKYLRVVNNLLAKFSEHHTNSNHN